MNKDATLNAAAGKYEGLERFKARKVVWADMEAAGITIKRDPHTMRWVASATVKHQQEACLSFSALHPHFPELCQYTTSSC